MILNTVTINRIKELSHLDFEQAKDFENLSHIITNATGRSVGVTTLKRLMGYIHDERRINEYTLNSKPSVYSVLQNIEKLSHYFK